MKADEYALEYFKDLLNIPKLSEIYDRVPLDGPADSTDILIKLLQKLHNETLALAKARKVSSNEGLLGALREANQKWKAIAKRINKDRLRVVDTAFVKFLKAKFEGDEGFKYFLERIENGSTSLSVRCSRINS